MDKRKVLIVDDEPHIRQLMSSVLSGDHVVLEAGSGEAAVDIARAEKPDLILMDIMMPGSDGYTACQEIKKDKTTQAIPIIMLTGVVYELNKKLAKGMGADGYITKPFNLQDLLDTVKQYEAPLCPVGA